MRREEGSRIGRDVRHARPLTGQGRHESRELGVPCPDTGPQVLRQRVQQRVGHPCLAAVQPLQTIQANIGSAEARALHAVADSLQVGEHTPELPLIRRLVRFEDDGPGIAGERLLQGHARRHSNAAREAVGYHRPPRAIGDDDRPVPQVRLPLQFDLRPEMSNQHTSDSQNLSHRVAIQQKGW